MIDADLGEALFEGEEQLAAAEAQFDFEVQPRTSPGMSVEKATVEWEESEAPFFKVATITVPRQTFATPERDRFGESRARSTQARAVPLWADFD